MLVRDVAAPALDVALPVWRQGKYAILDPAGTLRGVTAANETGQELPIVKIDKTTWRIETQGAKDVEVRYTVYANSLNDRTRHVDDSHAFLSGAAVFLYAPSRRSDFLSVRIESPVDWRISCGLETASQEPRTLIAPNYDALIDSPIEAGKHDLISFTVNGKLHEVAVWNGCNLNADRLEHDLTRIVQTEAGIFGELPYDRYVFILHIGPGLRGGTEHLNSTVMQCAPNAFSDDKQYKRLLSLAAHEMFHTWNVKRLRPASLRNIDLAKENYTDLLWFCEGATSYYDELVLVRAGLDTPEAYMTSLAEAIYQHRARPGSRVQSVTESSFDAWVKFNRPTPDDFNSTVSYYDAGALASLLLDMEIRKRTDNLASLDTLMREMYVSFPASGPGFSTSDLIAAAGRLTNSPFEYFFKKYIQGVETFPFEDAFSVVGLELRPSENARAFTGLQLQDENGACIVKGVLSSGPAYAAGVNVGDEIVALNGQRMTAKEFMSHVSDHRMPGDRVWLQIVRRSRLRRIDFELTAKPITRCRIEKVSSPTPEQNAAYRSWLGLPADGSA
jgi:predicted metalloprotease with PDZ domain